LTRHSSCCLRSHSDGRGWRLPLAIWLAAAAAAGAQGAADCTDCGSVAGSVTVWQAAVRSQGAKHDLDVVVYLEPAGAAELPPAEGKATMDQEGLVFLPHVLAVQKGTTVTFLNSDPDDHNVYFLNERTGDTLDIGTWGPGVSVDHTFVEAGPVITLCKLHLEMAAWVVVVDGPWFTTVRLDPETAAASFEIRQVPAGEYRLHAWHKKLRQKGGAAAVTVAPGAPAAAEVVITKAKYASG